MRHACSGVASAGNCKPLHTLREASAKSPGMTGRVVPSGIDGF